MIISKPKPNTLFSLGVFLAVIYSLLLFIVNSAVESNLFRWYHIAGIGVLGPIALGVSLKTLFGYKIIKIGDNKVSVYFPLRFSTKVYSLKTLVHWGEITIKTAAAPYHQVELLFENGKKVKIGKQENSNYDKVLNYFKKKHAKKKKDLG